MSLGRIDAPLSRSLVPRTSKSEAPIGLIKKDSTKIPDELLLSSTGRELVLPLHLSLVNKPPPPPPPPLILNKLLLLLRLLRLYHHHYPLHCAMPGTSGQPPWCSACLGLRQLY